MMFKRKRGGVKGLLNNVKKTALFLHDGFPNTRRKNTQQSGLWSCNTWSCEKPAEKLREPLCLPPLKHLWGGVRYPAWSCGRGSESPLGTCAASFNAQKKQKNRRALATNAKDPRQAVQGLFIVWTKFRLAWCHMNLSEGAMILAALSINRDT